MRPTSILNTIPYPWAMQPFEHLSKQMKQIYYGTKPNQKKAGALMAITCFLKME